MSKFALIFSLLCYFSNLSKSRTNTIVCVSMKNLDNLELEINSCWRWSAYFIIPWPLHHDPHPSCVAHRQQNHFSCISAALECFKATSHMAQSSHIWNSDSYKHGEWRVSVLFCSIISVVEECRQRLLKAGFLELKEVDQWDIQPSNKVGQLNSGNKAIFTHRNFSWFKWFIHFLIRSHHIFQMVDY